MPLERIERAVEYRLLGYKWGEIELLLNVPHSTLMRWYATPHWKAMAADWRARDPVTQQAKAVLSKALLHELSKKGRPDTALAERVYTLARESGHDDDPNHIKGGIVILPMQDRGLESKPPTQVLLPPSNAMTSSRIAPGPKATNKQPFKPTERRRVAGPDE